MTLWVEINCSMCKKELSGKILKNSTTSFIKDLKSNLPSYAIVKKINNWEEHFCSNECYRAFVAKENWGLK